ncbi:hypothetical protein BJ508DRAFT_306289 [Ascobolus immersus RN42]|uniref:Uncharacterized protein n=1 Tax=Ascobolus immersus RN42 TaxID=1160509 RepID=A0A3N4I6G0_ASCIM|nr:hypothetical protein BJ508DRAFT_306289 [Ascobolus immersus RN42]
MVRKLPPGHERHHSGATSNINESSIYAHHFSPMQHPSPYADTEANKEAHSSAYGYPNEERRDSFTSISTFHSTNPNPDPYGVPDSHKYSSTRSRIWFKLGEWKKSTRRGISKIGQKVPSLPSKESCHNFCGPCLLFLFVVAFIFVGLFLVYMLFSAMARSSYGRTNDYAPMNITDEILVVATPSVWVQDLTQKDKELLAMGTADLPIFNVPDQLRNNERLHSRTESFPWLHVTEEEEKDAIIPEEIKYMRCLDLMTGDSESYYRGSKVKESLVLEIQRNSGYDRKFIENMMFTLVWGKRLRNCWLMTEEVLRVQEQWAGSDLGWMKKGDEKNGTVAELQA